MRFAINKDILKSTTKCRDNYSCLAGDDRCFCEIEDCSEEKVHFIIPGTAAGMCDYRMGFGYSFTCNCPVRKEIYNQYRV
ncbi:MAG: hypothetical protein C4538_09155 [Nitrospiraceae bacterium]|nr:MAG: hypothetical protein C4538_09155 [Nitrospiraceae bacterium]